MTFAPPQAAWHRDDQNPPPLVALGQLELQKRCSVIAVMLGKQIAVGQEVTLGGYPSEWLRVDRSEGKSVHVRRSFGEPAVYSAGFWIDGVVIRAARWPDRSPQS